MMCKNECVIAGSMAVIEERMRFSSHVKALAFDRSKDMLFTVIAEKVVVIYSW